MARLLPKPDPIRDDVRDDVRDACQRVWHLRIVRAGAERDHEAARAGAFSSRLEWYGHRTEGELVEWIEALRAQEAEARQALDGLEIPDDYRARYLEENG